MDLRGFLIRCHRLQRNYSQEGLCHGICAVSYLSKLEQGKVQAADEIYQALFHRLGIAFQEQPEWLTVWKEKLQELAAAWFYEEQSEAFELEEQMERLLNSPLCVDALLIKALYEKEQAETTLASASVFLPYMQDDQRFLYHFLCARQAFQAKEAHALSEILAQLQEAQKYGGWSILYQEKGYVYARMGDYSQALHHHLKAYDLACEEGFLQMQAHVWYNIGSTYQQWGEDQKALPLLLKAYQILDDTFLCCHKLALLYERLDQKKEGLRYVQEMERQLDSHENDGRREIVQFVKYRYGTAVDAKVYIDCLYKLCDSSLYFHGFRQFHLSYLITALKKSRRYKEVMQLMEETEFS